MIKFILKLVGAITLIYVLLLGVIAIFDWIVIGRKKK